MNERELFLQALDIDEANARDQFLREVCGDNQALYRDVLALLDAHQKASGFLAQDNLADVKRTPNAAEPTVGHRFDSSAGSLIAGRYKLLQQIGEGGMGAVWMADQTEPVKRRVAVKLIRADKGTSKSILSRFEAERQAIALMDHPNIAKLLDAGTTEDGLPFFVMELVKGIPVTEYCDVHRLSITDRLSLFMQVCSAVQHAHQKGIIHRDIKPSNILVESHDGKPVPKIIDFGLAKATSGMQLSENTLFTGFGNVLGTPLYMAPEQANFNAIDVDTRADVYALGVILYELLTGTTPITRETVKKAAIDEMLKMIREQDAPTPSSRLSTSESRPSIATNRNTEPEKLGRFVKGELDWIVMKALSKERDRRYETATGFAKDIERFLGNEPVQAGPPSVGYKLRKFVRRNRSQVVAASLVLFALFAGIVGTSWGLVKARRQHEIALLAVDSERKAKQEAEEKRAEAERQTTRAEEGEKLASDRLIQAESEKQIAQAVKDFLQNKLLGQADPLKQAESLLNTGESTDQIESNPTINELLDRAANQLTTESIDANFPNQPILQAELLATVGETYRKTGRSSQALQLIDRALAIFVGTPNASVSEQVRLMNSKASILRYQDDDEAAIAVAESSWLLAKKELGELHPDTIAAIDTLAGCQLQAGRTVESLKLYVMALTSCEKALPANDSRTAEVKNNYALALQRDRQFEKAIALQERIVENRIQCCGLSHPETIVSRVNLACFYRDVGRLVEARTILEESWTAAESVYGDDHPVTITVLIQLATTLLDSVDKAESITILEKCLRILKDRYGEGHSLTFHAQNQLALAYLQANRASESIALLESMMRMQREKHGKSSRGTMTSIYTLAQAYASVGRVGEAVQLSTIALDDAKSQLGNEDPTVLKFKSLLAQCLIAQKKTTLAAKLYEEVLDVRVRNLGNEHPDTILSTINLGYCYRATKNYDEAIKLFENTLKGLENSGRPLSSRAYLLKANLANIYFLSDRKKDAEFIALAVIQDATNSHGEKSEAVSVANTILAKLYFEDKRWKDAIPLLEPAYDRYQSTKIYSDSVERLGTCYAQVGELGKAADIGVIVLEHLADKPESTQRVTTDLLGQLGERLVLKGESDKANSLLSECLIARERKNRGPNDLILARIKAALGAAKMKLGQLETAESLLIAGQQEMKSILTNLAVASIANPQPEVQRILLQSHRQMVDWLIDLYTQLEKPDEVSRWKEERSRIEHSAATVSETK